MMTVRWLLLCAALAVVLVACGGGSSSGGPSGVVNGKITIPHSSIAALDKFAFTTKLDVAAADGNYSLTFDGRFQKPDRIQGTLHLDGKFIQDFAWLNRPLDATEIVNIGTYAWWRKPGGAWQPGIPKGYEQEDPLVSFRQYATPWFYLNAFLFNTLSLPVNGGAEQINAVQAVPVRLDKQGIIDALGQGGDVKMYPDETHEPVATPKVPTSIIENARQVLPANFTVDVWFAQKELYPSRIVFEYDITKDDPKTLTFGFKPPFHLRLQMDITDPHADKSVEPPLPIVEPTPSPTTPPGATIPVLSEQDKARIKEIALADPYLKPMLADRQYETGEPYVWHSSNLQLLGGGMDIKFTQPVDIEADWPTFARDDSSYELITFHVRAERVETLHVNVLLAEDRVARIDPMGKSMKVSNYTPPPGFTPAPPSGE
jgi:hypothetical protein